MAAPVFIVGCPRSGTTLLQQLLNAHPEIVIGPETFFVRRFWLGRESSYLEGNEASWQSLVDSLGEAPALEDAGVSREQWFRGVESLDQPATPAALLSLLLSLFTEAFGAPETRIVGEKTPNHLLYMPLLQEWLPGARFIHMLRDPRAVVNSWRAVPWSSGSLMGDAAVWRRYVRTAGRHPPAAGTLLEVSYEALVAEPAMELRRICAFLGVEFREEMLTDRTRPFGLDAEREPWKRAATGPVSPEAAARWRTELSAWQVLLVEATVGKMLEATGYTATRRVGVRALFGSPLRGLAWFRARLNSLKRGTE